MVGTKVRFEKNVSTPPPLHAPEIIGTIPISRIFRFSIGDGKCPGWYVSGMVNVRRVSVHLVSVRDGN